MEEPPKKICKKCGTDFVPYKSRPGMAVCRFCYNAKRRKQYPGIAKYERHRRQIYYYTHEREQDS